METPSPLTSRHITIPKGKKSFKSIVPNIILMHNAYFKIETRPDFSTELDNLETALETHWNMVSNPSSRASLTTLAQNIRTLYTIMTSVHNVPVQNAFWKRETSRVRYALGEHLALYKTKDVHRRMK
jgi:hypothetical protein